MCSKKLKLWLQLWMIFHCYLHSDVKVGRAFHRKWNTSRNVGTRCDFILIMPFCFPSHLPRRLSPTCVSSLRIIHLLFTSVALPSPFLSRIMIWCCALNWWCMMKNNCLLLWTPSRRIKEAIRQLSWFRFCGCVLITISLCWKCVHYLNKDNLECLQRSQTLFPFHENINKTFPPCM